MKLFKSIRKRLEAATPGPWTAQIPAMTGEYPMGRIKPLKIQGKLYGSPMVKIDDAEFISHSPTDIAALLEALDVAESALAFVVNCSYGTNSRPIAEEALSKIKQLEEKTK